MGADSYIEGIEGPTEAEFKKCDYEIRKITFEVMEPGFEPTADIFEVLQDVLNSANTVRNYYKQLQMEVQKGGGVKRRRDTANVSDSEGTPRPSKAPRVTASGKRFRGDVDSRDDNKDLSTFRPSKMSQLTMGKKRSRDDSSEDESTSKRPRLGEEKVDLKKAVEGLQAVLDSKGLK